MEGIALGCMEITMAAQKLASYGSPNTFINTMYHKLLIDTKAQHDVIRGTPLYGSTLQIEIVCDSV